MNVLDVNEPPFNLSISSNVVLENQQAGAQVGFLTASDPDGLVRNKLITESRPIW